MGPHDLLLECRPGRPVQMQLAGEGISARLENAAFLSWFWHYSIATGGVKLWVLEGDAQDAQAVLWSWRETASVTGTPWQCPKSGESVDSAWSTCWHCGVSKDGEEDPSFWEQPALESPPWRCSERTLATIVGLSGPLVFLLSRGSLPALAIWVVAVVWLRMLQNWQVAEEDGKRSDVDRPSRLMVEAAPEDAARATADDDTQLEETIRRAWQTAVLSLWFFPLVFYSLWLLWRLALPEGPLHPREQRRYVGAWAFNCFELAKAAFWFWFFLGGAPFELCTDDSGFCDESS